MAQIVVFPFVITIDNNRRFNRDCVGSAWDVFLQIQMPER